MNDADRLCQYADKLIGHVRGAFVRSQVARDEAARLLRQLRTSIREAKAQLPAP